MKMKKMVILCVLAVSFLVADVIAEPNDVIFRDGGDKVFTVDGLYWFAENGGSYCRLPVKSLDKMTPWVKWLSYNPSGARIRFKTDSTSLQLKIKHGTGNAGNKSNLSMYHMCSVGASGIDLYEGPVGDMDFWAITGPTDQENFYSHTYFTGIEKKMREFTLYLPVYNNLEALEIGLDKDAQIAPPSKYRLDKPIVFYGTSITQSGCPCRGSNGFVPVVGRQLGVNVINLGFSGSGCSEPEMAEVIAEIDAACYVIDSVANMDPKTMAERYDNFIKIIRKSWPEKPIVLMTKIHYASENIEGSDYLKSINQMVLDSYNKFKADGDKNIYFFDSAKVIGEKGDHPSVDGVHLSDLGFKMLADELSPYLAKIVGLDYKPKN